MIEPILPEILFSMNALRRSWRMVRRNGGSSGSDGQKPQQFEERLIEELNRLRQQIIGGTYKPQPVRRYFARKASGKQRPICIWALRDRVAQRVIHDYLTPVLEEIFLESSYGFRPNRSVNDAVRALIQARNTGLRWVLDADITDCFGSIKPALMMAQVQRVVQSPVVCNLIMQWLHTPVHGNSHDVAGISQGGVISPQLANLYLHRFDEMIAAALPQVRLIRFADDFVILCHGEDDATWSLEVARRSLANLHLMLNMRKTRITNFEEGFVFLGVTFKGDAHHFPKNMNIKLKEM